LSNADPAQSLRQRLQPQQRQLFLLASGLSTAGSFAGLTAKGWILMHGTGEPLMLALHFAALSLPALLLSGPAGVLTDRIGSEVVLIRAQWGLFAGGLLGALAIPLLAGQAQVLLLLLSTLVVGVASSFELTARNKYTALLVDAPSELAPFLASFSVVFNVGKLVGPPLGGWLLAIAGPTLALGIDAATYLLPIATVLWLLSPRREAERSSGEGRSASLATAWRECGPQLRHILRFTALACLVVFFHPGLAPYMAAELVGPSPYALGLFTGVLAAGSITGGLLLQRQSRWWSQRPGLLLGGCTTITAGAQLLLACAGSSQLLSLAMVFLIGMGTAGLLGGSSLISQVGSPMQLRGRMAGLAQIAFLGGGGLSGLLAALLTRRYGLMATCGLLGGIGLALGLTELWKQGGMRLKEA
jgi:MFS family permease